MKDMKPLELLAPTSLKTGLTLEQVRQAPKNQIDSNPQKTIGQLAFEEFFSFFNIVNYILAAIVLYTGSYRNLLFMIIVLSNTVIGLYQKIHSRRILNKLALLHAQKYQVLRDGKWQAIESEDIAQGDILRLNAGLQIPCDGVIRFGECQVNESPLTGESDALDRIEGGSLYGGCFVVSGTCLMQAVDVGSAQYMATIIKEARREKEYPSQLRDVLNSIIKFCTIILFPAGILLFCKLFFYSGVELNTALLNTTASMVGMIPEGLIILTSTALAAAAVKMARKAVLIHELYCIENLARVDTLCLDKTGTITSGKMNVVQYLPLDGQSEAQMKQALANLFGSLEDDNMTAQAIRRSLYPLTPTEKSNVRFPFSSTWKSSGAVFGDTTLIVGAYSFIFEKTDPKVLAQIEQYAAQGLRVLVLAKTGPIEKLAKGNYTLCGLILIEDEIRPDAKEILDYFKSQDVDLKIISGDMVTTVAAIAKKAGVDGYAVDMSKVADDQIGEVVAHNSIFGRVSPTQKMLMVKALQQQGHTVGMTGDGVNDVMALKQADCSIAMGSGAQAAMAVASLVLLQDQFAVLPQIVAEGRCVINNIQRTASLFLVKTIFSFLLTVLTVVWMQAYPFVPIQLTFVSAIGTGIPAFILTFENDISRPKGSFLVSVLSRAIPGALAISCGISVLYCIVQYGSVDVSMEQYQTMCTLLAALNALGVLYMICRPLSFLRLLVLSFSVLMAIGGILLLPNVFFLYRLSWTLNLIVLAVGAGQEFLLYQLWQVRWSKYLNKLPLVARSAAVSD